MPIYDYHCQPCNINIQVFCDVDERNSQRCEKCKKFLSQMVSVFANTPARWGDSHGYFDRGLGCYVANSMERDRIMKERNLRPVSQTELLDNANAVSDEHDQHEKDIATFNAALEKTGDMAEAAAITFPQDRLDPSPEDISRTTRYEWEKPWKEDLEVINKETTTTNKDETT
jgi:putative FmdB family regulatory protein